MNNQTKAERQKIVKEANYLKEQKYSCTKIANLLNVKGYRTTNGARWQKSSVLLMFQDPEHFIEYVRKLRPKGLQYNKGQKYIKETYSITKQERVEILEIINHFHEQGLSIYAIVAILNSTGHISPKGKKFYDKTVSNIIKDPAAFLDPPKRPVNIMVATKDKKKDSLLFRVTSNGDYVAYCTEQKKPVLKGNSYKEVDKFIKEQKN